MNKSERKAARSAAHTKAAAPAASPAPAAKSEAAPAATAKPTRVVAAGNITVIKKDAKFRGAREAWHALLVKHDGKPVADFYEAAKKTPPALTKQGTAEDPRGWLRYFVRTGTASLSG